MSEEDGRKLARLRQNRLSAARSVVRRKQHYAALAVKVNEQSEKIAEQSAQLKCVEEEKARLIEEVRRLSDLAVGVKCT
jgi:uncharacterized protein (DUF3084 family)